MRRYERSEEAVTVTYAGTPIASTAERLEARSADELLDAVAHSSDPTNVVVVLDPVCAGEGVDHDGDGVVDHVIALSSVLVQRGVRAIETHYVVAVERVFAMYQAIHAGVVEGELGEVANP